MTAEAAANFRLFAGRHRAKYAGADDAGASGGEGRALLPKPFPAFIKLS
jgi:hypothetical protein